MSSLALAAVAIETLIGCGVTDLVASPGSRNTSLLLAAHRAEEAGRLRLHVRVDERVAGFLALGLAKASERVVAVVRLSSSSGGQEAWSAGVQRACALASGARTRQPGPVQLNLEFEPPLAGALPEVSPRAARIEGSRPGPVVEVEGGPATVVLAGDATPAVGAEARALAEVSGLPLLAEPSSNARAGEHAVAHYRRLLGEDLGRRIERVICFGHPTLSRPVSALLARPGVELIVVSDQARWPDPGLNAARVVDRVLAEPGDPSWLAAWRAADRRLLAERAGSARFDGRAVAASVVAALGPGENLVLGSSNCIRDADEAPVPARAYPVYANRGLAGIDGVVSTSTGIALATGRRTTVLLGDLTLQHDLGALVRPPLERRAGLRIVVQHDDGGSIFSSLEQGAPEFAGAFERVFGTPQGLDLASVAASLGWDAAEANDAEALERELRAGREFVVSRVPREPR